MAERPEPVVTAVRCACGTPRDPSMILCPNPFCGVVWVRPIVKAA